MPDLLLTAPAKSHLLKLVKSLLSTGWTIDKIPDNGRLLRNGQKILFRSDRLDLRVRLFVYKVTGSGRARPEERRIEITSTYQKGLPPLPRFRDVVLGYETDSHIYVGVDSQRIEHGGLTGNASSFFDKEGLGFAKPDTISVLPRKAALFAKGIEYHAFVNPLRLPEYLFNLKEIHAGSYQGDGLYSGKLRTRKGAVSLQVNEDVLGGDVLILSGPKPPTRAGQPKIEKRIIEAFEKGKLPKKKRKISPEEFLKIKRTMEENGRLGEEHVLKAERSRLKRAKRSDLAAKISWVSQESVAEGYDILSFEVTGEERFIEVKATAGKQNTFEMSDNEWQKACEFGEQYYICRVISVRDDPSHIHIKNPRQLELEGRVQKTTTGWRVTYHP
jgi:Domain of unknown function (DUF3883)